MTANIRICEDAKVCAQMAYMEDAWRGCAEKRNKRIGKNSFRVGTGGDRNLSAVNMLAADEHSAGGFAGSKLFFNGNNSPKFRDKFAAKIYQEFVDYQKDFFAKVFRNVGGARICVRVIRPAQNPA